MAYNMTKHHFFYTKRIISLCVLCIALSSHIQAQFLIKGKASYYHDALHGNQMSNGDYYHRDSMTCAHLKLPFGTMLKVRNLRNNKEVIVEVTDRGPYAKKYILDLSRAAAKELGIIGIGFAPVEISIHTPAKVPFRLKDEEVQIPDLDLEHQILAIYPEPLWQQADSIVTKPEKVK